MNLDYIELIGIVILITIFIGTLPGWFLCLTSIIIPMAAFWIFVTVFLIIYFSKRNKRKY